MDSRYAHIGELDDRAAEECAELIFAIMKAKRFGLFNHNPHTKVINLDAIINECNDVLWYANELKTKLVFIRKTYPASMYGA